MKEENFLEYAEKLDTSANDILSIAIEEATKRNHAHVLPEHMMLALLEKERAFFNSLIISRGLKADNIFTKLRSSLSFAEWKEPSIKAILRAAYINSFSRGANKIESCDLLVPVITQCTGLSQTLLDQGIDSQLLEIHVAEYSKLKNPSLEKKILPEEKKQAVREAVQSGQFEEAYSILSEFYTKAYLTGTFIFRILIGTIVALAVSVLLLLVLR